uniref:Wx2 n=1 Tax=Toxoplasma gondii TaxID=5811 RepID=Q86L95_TOXGO|nr:wx2 [Toxoplasma gondii]
MYICIEGTQKGRITDAHAKTHSSQTRWRPAPAVPLLHSPIHMTFSFDRRDENIRKAVSVVLRIASRRRREEIPPYSGLFGFPQFASAFRVPFFVVSPPSSPFLCFLSLLSNRLCGSPPSLRSSTLLLGVERVDPSSRFLSSLDTSERELTASHHPQNTRTGSHVRYTHEVFFLRLHLNVHRSQATP